MKKAVVGQSDYSLKFFKRCWIVVFRMMERCIKDVRKMLQRCLKML